ncbi:hypothetical protein D3C86_1500830 [compost metagenome]
MGDQFLNGLKGKDQTTDLGLIRVSYRAIANHQAGQTIYPVVSVQSDEATTVSHKLAGSLAQGAGSEVTVMGKGAVTVVEKCVEARYSRLCCKQCFHPANQIKPSAQTFIACKYVRKGERF